MKLKKLLSVFIVIALSLSLGACVEQDQRRILSKPVSAASPASITIYAFNGKSERFFGIPNMGHSFISIKNLSTADITIGKYVLAPDEEMTLGTWGQTVHWGIWYNLEAHYMQMDRYQGIVSLTREIDAQDYDKLGDFILDHDYWTMADNCSFFAVSLWNTVANDDAFVVKNGYTPQKVKDIIDSYDEMQTDRWIVPQTLSGYFDDSTYVSCQYVAQ